MKNTIQKLPNNDFKVLPTGVTTFKSKPNGIERIEVIEPTEVKARFITKKEFKQVVEMVSQLPFANVNHLHLCYRGISFEIYKDFREKLRIDNIYINDVFIYMTSKQFKTIYKILNS